MSTLESYSRGIESLLELDATRTEVFYKGNQEGHFLRLQSLIRCSIQHCNAAMSVAKENQILSALVLTRTAMEHALMARYLDQALDGHELSEIVMDKHRLDLGRMAQLAGSTEAGEKLLEMVQFKQNDHDRVATNPTKIIGKFSQKAMLDHLYFLLSQSSHPISAFMQYVEFDKDGKSKRLRRHALIQDQMSVMPFLFQILAITLLTDASISNDQTLEKAVISIATQAFSTQDFILTVS